MLCVFFLRSETKAIRVLNESESALAYLLRPAVSVQLLRWDGGGRVGLQFSAVVCTSLATLIAIEIQSFLWPISSEHPCQLIVIGVGWRWG